MYLEEDIPTEQYKEKKNLWVFIQNEHKGWEKCVKQKEEKRKEKARGLTTMLTLLCFAFARL